MNTSQNKCIFCNLGKRKIIESHYGILIRDLFPLNEGHSLVIPKRHVTSWFHCELNEQIDLIGLLNQAKRLLDVEYSPASYNIGINDGTAAGQTISHMHIHLIPRYLGDVQDPRGGIRWLMPDKAKYW